MLKIADGDPSGHHKNPLPGSSVARRERVAISLAGRTVQTAKPPSETYFEVSAELLCLLPNDPDPKR
jgi:hypothetical protein